MNRTVDDLIRIPSLTIYLRMSEGAFPEPISLGTRSVRWIESEIDAWIARRIAEIRNTRPALQSASTV